MSKKATVELVFGRSGSGAPCAVTPCQTSIDATNAAATKTPMRKASFICDVSVAQRLDNCC